MTKDLVAQRIRALAQARGGHVSLDAFLPETGIKDKWLRTQPWFGGWNNLLQELGLATKSFEVPRAQPEALARAVGTLIAREGKFWSAREGSLLLGCGAPKELDRQHGELKSMRTPNAPRRRGAGRAILTHILSAARARGYERLSLETGSMQAFRPAQSLYESFGFEYCGPFGSHVEDPNSVFMTLRL